MKRERDILFKAACKHDNILSAWDKVRDNKGCAGADYVTLDMFADSLDEQLARLRTELLAGTYRPVPLRRIIIPKEDGAKRKLGIPAVRDRVAQQAVLNIIGPLFEEEFEECSFAYRKGRSIYTAIARIEALRSDGYTYVVDADIDDYFDEIDHRLLLRSVRRHISDRRIVRLIELWLATGILEGFGVRRRDEGVPQGAVISPVLANLYLDAFDEKLTEKGYKLVRYSDDFVILCRDVPQAERALKDTERLLGELHLKLNREKTQITSFTNGFRYLGALFVSSMVVTPKPGRKVKKTAIDERKPDGMNSVAGDSNDDEESGILLTATPKYAQVNKHQRSGTRRTRHKRHRYTQSFYPFRDECIEISSLSDYVYCRNAFYCRRVLGERTQTQEMVAGHVEHEAVHKSCSFRRDGRRVQTSMPVYSQRLGVSGRVDIVEEKDGMLYPVEYKAGPRTEVWLNVRVQLCAQAMALEEMTGRTIEHGYVYFTESRRREKVTFTALLRSYAERVVAEAREMERTGRPGVPVPGARCYGCSSKHVCLPHETTSIKRFSRKGVLERIMR